jgi:hypothetical protein
MCRLRLTDKSNAVKIREQEKKELEDGEKICNMLVSACHGLFRLLVRARFAGR